MHIVADDLTGPAIRALLEDHLRDMHAQSPPESVHAMDVTRLSRPDVSFWSAWDGETLLGCAALRELDATQGEVKSMRTAPASRGRGVARALLAHVVAEARARGYARLSLETGSQPGFEPARRLYASAGFECCAPFADYVEDPNSVFMTLELPIMKITVETRVDAPIAAVWQAWTTPADIVQWNTASPDWHTTRAAVDLRVGGEFSSRMEARDGSMGFDFAGTYTQVVPHTLLEASFGERTMRVEFEEGPGGVTVRETFDAETTYPVEQQRQGWQAILDSFARHVERGR